MDEHNKSAHNHEAEVYNEASNWVRLANQVIWGLGSLFVPTSLAALWLGVSTSNYKLPLAILSISILLAWVAITRIYAASSQVARKALVEIETKWGLDEDLCFYRLQNDLFNKKWNVKSLQIVMVFILSLVWVFVLFDPL